MFEDDLKVAFPDIKERFKNKSCSESSQTSKKCFLATLGEL